jgi:hypothetical protein
LLQQARLAFPLIGLEFSRVLSITCGRVIAGIPGTRLAEMGIN